MIGQFEILNAMWDEASAKRLGLTLRRLRNETGLSQESLAHLAGITKNQLQLIESGRSVGRQSGPGPSNPRLETLSGIASALNMKMSELLAAAEL